MSKKSVIPANFKESRMMSKYTDIRNIWSMQPKLARVCLLVISVGIETHELGPGKRQTNKQTFCHYFFNKHLNLSLFLGVTWRASIMKHCPFCALLVQHSEPGVDMAWTNIRISVIPESKQKKINLFVLQFLLDTDFHCRTFAIVGKVIEVKMVGNYKTNTNTTIRQIQI